MIWFLALVLIEGTVHDDKGSTVAGATVEVREKSNVMQTAQSDGKGQFHISIADGDYVVQARKGLAISSPVPAAKKLDLILKAVEFSDEPSFVVAGVTDNTYMGGHGSDTSVRSAQKLTKTLKPEAETGDPLQRVHQFQQATELDPSEGNFFDWGMELLSYAAPQAASEVFEKGLHRYPQATRLLLADAVALYSESKFDGAVQQFFAATDVKPDDPEPYRYLGEVEEARTMPGYKERMARFARAHPENGWANYYYAMTLPDGDQKRALLQKANIGEAYLQLGNYEKAVELSPGLAQAHYRLAMAYRKAGLTDKAEHELELFRQFNQKEQPASVRFVITLKGH